MQRRLAFTFVFILPILSILFNAVFEQDRQDAQDEMKVLVEAWSAACLKTLQALGAAQGHLLQQDRQPGLAAVPAEVAAQG